MAEGTGWIRTAAAVLILIGISTAFPLCAGELWVNQPQAVRMTGKMSLKGLYQPSETTGFDNVPGWQGVYDDEIARGAIRINSLGQRDDEPATARPDVRRVLLIGDSFAFGYALDEGETIDKQIERLSEGRVDAYNQGVNGHGPGDILAKLRANDWWKGSDVFYLFYHNDLREDNATPAYHGVFEGYVVPRRKSDGSAYTEDEYREFVSRHERHIAANKTSRLSWAWIQSALKLEGIRRRIALLLGADEELVDGSLSMYRPEYTAAAVKTTRQMAAIVEERGARFHVVVVPSLGETAFGRYARVTADYVAAASDAGIHVIELRERLSADDYFAHDGHFNPHGAARAARAILEVVGS